MEEDIKFLESMKKRISLHSDEIKGIDKVIYSLKRGGRFEKMWPFLKSKLGWSSEEVDRGMRRIMRQIEDIFFPELIGKEDEIIGK